MKKLFWTPLLIAFLAPPAAAETAEDLDTWFREGYAALYEKNAWDHADDFAQYIADVITTRSDDGLSESAADSFLVDYLEEWRSEGWLGSDVEELDTKLLNATTAVFDIKWLDRNADGSTENDCAWYVADKIDGKWLLSQYITMSCFEAPTS